METVTGFNYFGIDIIKTSSMITIYDSYKITDDSKKEAVLKRVLEEYPEFTHYNRNIKNMLIEWKAHNILYQHNYKRTCTQDADFEIQLKLRHRIGYFLITTFMREKKKL